MNARAPATTGAASAAPAGPAGADERALTFACAGETLPGILAGAGTNADCAVLIVVGGPQYRAGSHRQFVQLARRLAAAGWPSLRFDVRGMGDASGASRSFEALDDDIAAAIDALGTALPGVRRIVLWGLCDGASAALLYVQRRRDPRVAGLCLVNPWVRQAASLARVHVTHYYLRRIREREFWAKMMNARAAWTASAEFVRNLRLALSGANTAGGRAASFREQMAAGWRRHAGPLLLVTSGADLTAEEFLQCARSDPAWRGALSRPGLAHVAIDGADHTCSRAADRLALESSLLRWLDAEFRRCGR
jgi:exosortase A-associated hydrolase 1